VDTGLLIVRLVVGLVVAAHGLQILFGKLDGLGLQTSAAAFDRIGYRPGKLFATAAGLSESSGGLLLAAGLVTPLAAAAIVSVMFAAALSSHLKNGFWITNGGYEYTLTLGLVAMGIGFIGPGSYSLDHLLGWTLSGSWWRLLAFAVALAATIPIEAYRRERIQAVTANHQSTSAAD
jgi:putative oxidoreductase